MAKRLTDIEVKRVSFVKRAATRDPKDPSEPRTFLMVKSEDGDPNERTRTMATTTLSTSDRAALDAAIRDLEDSGDPRLQGELERLRVLRNPEGQRHGGPDNFGPAAGSAVAKVDELLSLRKAEGLTESQARARVYQSHPQLIRKAEQERQIGRPAQHDVQAATARQPGAARRAHDAAVEHTMQVEGCGRHAAMEKVRQRQPGLATAVAAEEAAALAA